LAINFPLGTVSGSEISTLRPMPLDPSVLSERELKIFELATLGQTDEQIARSLDIRSSTLNSYWARIRGKLGHLPRTALIAGVLVYRYEQRIEQLEQEVRQLRSELSGSSVPASFAGAGGMPDNAPSLPGS